jgi:hypothetical protein
MNHNLPKQIQPLLLAITALAFAALACGLPGRTAQPSATPAPVLTTNAPAAQPSPTPAQPTTVPPTAAPATATTAPTAAANPSAVRVTFAAGATSGFATGSLQPGEVKNFLIGAAQGQPLLLSVDSPNTDVTLAVTGQTDDKTLLAAAQKTSSWQTMLTVTQDYQVQVIGGASQENFTLNVTTPARINFAAGAVTAKVTGSTPGGLNVAYVLRANAGQTLKVTLQPTPSGDGVLSIYGYQDGQPYLRYVVEQTTFSMVLPATEDYIIQVVPRGGKAIQYSMEVEIK